VRGEPPCQEGGPNGSPQRPDTQLTAAHGGAVKDGRSRRLAARAQRSVLDGAEYVADLQAIAGALEPAHASDGRHPRVGYAARGPVFFVRLFAGGFRNVSPSISIGAGSILKPWCRASSR